MSHIQRIRAQHVRSHADYTAELSPDASVITGANGTGKTSLLEALYIALQGSSFRSSDNEVLAQGASWYRIDVSLDQDRTRTVKFDAERITGRKQFMIDGRTHYRLSSQYKYPVVLFEPDDLRLLSGSPSRRRQFIDRFISQIDTGYGVAIRRYDRALKQRNTLLKHGTTSDELFAWNVSLSEYGAYITKQRIFFIDLLNQELREVYATIAASNDTTVIRYSHNVDTQQKLLAELHAHTEKDLVLGFTSTGPHRHDVLFDFNGSSALGVASRGEIRSIVLALKFLEVRITERLTDKKPVILLDDVFSELDETRQKNLVTEFKDHQIIITSVTTVPIRGSTVIRL